MCMYSSFFLGGVSSSRYGTCRRFKQSSPGKEVMNSVEVDGDG